MAKSGSKDEALPSNKAAIEQRQLEKDCAFPDGRMRKKKRKYTVRRAETSSLGVIDLSRRRSDRRLRVQQVSINDDIVNGGIISEIQFPWHKSYGLLYWLACSMCARSIWEIGSPLRKLNLIDSMDGY
ncbi:hypothetical protein HZH66_011125 [Vespula vulgaris]|uniref:Uncharacterized protein n=1 Tax=Vespula vulgaris TaxID=7454 RepID=A0A834MXG3_VESVU|nr:hypothetical protein HZH66_011125 [Vespula vulgaris]